MLNLYCTPGRKIGLLVWTTLCAILLSSVMLLGQSTVSTGAIRGTVSDQAGVGLAGAKVIITFRATARVVQVVTSSDGMYSSGPLQPGGYTVRVEAKGFKTPEFSVMALAGVVSSGNVQLQPGQESAVVHPGTTTLNLEQPVVQSVLRADQIELLPVNGRNYLDFAQFVPGVQMQDGGVLDASKSGLASISFESRFGRAARIDVDGVDVSDETVGTTTQNISSSAIEEFNLSQSTLDLTTGLTSTGAVSVTTRSGGKDLHGEAFGAFRGDQGAAVLPGSTSNHFSREQFGARVGGTLIKDTLFFFLDAERSKQDWTAPEPFAAPFNASPTAIAEPFRELMADGRLDWQGRKDTHAFYRFNFDEVSQVGPFGAFSSLQSVMNALHTPSHTLGYDFTKGNYTHSIRFEYLRMGDGIGDVTGTIPAGIDNPIPGLGFNIGAPVQGNCALSSGGAFCGGPSQFAPEVRMQSDYEVKYDGTRGMGNHIFRYGATLNRIQGGGFTALSSNPQVGTTSVCLPGSLPSNCVSGAAPTAYPADFVFLGNGLGFSTAQSAFGYSGGGLGPDNRIEAYAGDDWKIKHNLTLTYGLHYARDTGRVDSNLGPEATFNLWQPGLGSRVRTPNQNVAPQFGFAWDMGGSGKTVIRGGGGLFFENSLWNNMQADSLARVKNGMLSYAPEVCSSGAPSNFTWPSSLSTMPVYSPIAGGAGIVTDPATNQVQPTFCGGTIASVANDILALSSAFKAAAAGTGSQPNSNYIGTALNASNAAGVDVFDPNYRAPRSWQMNLGVQHEFRKGMVFSADYVRNIGEHYLIGIDQNHSGAARSFNQANALIARDNAQLSHGCLAGLNQANCMVLNLGQAGAQAAYSTAGLDSNIAATGGAPCAYCAFPGITPKGINNTGSGAGNGALGAMDTLEPIGRSVYSGYQFSWVQSLVNPWPGVKAANFRVTYSFSKFISQAQDQDFINLATNNDNPLQYTGPTGLDRKHQVSLAGTFDLPYLTRVSVIGHFYSPLPQNLQLPELTNGGEIFATDWLGSGLGSGAVPEPLPGTQIGQFMRGTDNSNLHTVISDYNTHFAGQLTPAGQCLVGSQSCPGSAPIPVMTQSDMDALGWVMPKIASVNPEAMNFPWLKSVDLKAAWPIKIRERFTVEPSASVFNVFNFSNSFLPGNLPLASLLPGGPNGTLAPNAVGGVTGAGLTPFRAGLQSGTYALGAPRRFEFGLRIEF
jgi:Carboxypeptidase regulatory-like domain